VNAEPRWFTVVEPRLLGGEHPCPGANTGVHRARIDALLTRGVTTFVDLTERARENGIQPYERFLRGRVYHGLSVASFKFPVSDAGVPTSSSRLDTLLDVIDAALCNGEMIHVHCRSGVGRTGMVLALQLVRHGVSATEALRLVQAAWRRDARSRLYARSPQTDRQRAFVRDYDTS